MRIGLCLPGGGAKGAFQAGALKRILENGINPAIVAGTSIGAVNAYFLMKGSMGELYDVWNSMNEISHGGEQNKVVDNSALISQLACLEGENRGIEKVFVNYVEIENRQLKEVVVEISNEEKPMALEAVKYSSLLPFNGGGEEGQDEAFSKFDSQKVFEKFREDVSQGGYDGWKLDGGIVNNNLLTPFINHRVDKIIIIPLKDGYKVPEYIFNQYRGGDILVIDPDFAVMPQDTLRFEKEYCRDMFNKGYLRAESVCRELI